MPESQTPWEDHLLERKTDRTSKDIRRTAVAFANSVRPGHVAVILVGEEDDGTVSGVANPEDMQKKIRNEMDKIYPAIVWRQQLYEKAGKTCVRVEIEYSGETPHFGDTAWIRSGTETIKAPDLVFQQLIDLRTSKYRELMLHLNKHVTVSWSAGFISSRPNWGMVTVKLVQVTRWYAIFLREDNNARKSEPLDWLTLSWDNTRMQLHLYVHPELSSQGL